MLQPVPAGTPQLTPRSAPPASRANPAPSVPEGDRVILGARSEAAEESPSRLGTWQSLGLLGLGALTLVGCAGIPGYVGGAAAAPPETSVSRTVDTAAVDHQPSAVEKWAFGSRTGQSPVTHTPSAVEKWAFGSKSESTPTTPPSSQIMDTFVGYYPMPSTWAPQELDFGAIGFKTAVPPGWTLRTEGQGFWISNDADPSASIAVQSFDGAQGAGGLQQAIENQKGQLHEQGFELRETYNGEVAQGFHLSVNEVVGIDGTWRVEIFAYSDTGDASMGTTGTLTTMVYNTDQDRAIFPTVLQSTRKVFQVNAPLPIQH